jgi:hypothetical protein
MSLKLPQSSDMNCPIRSEGSHNTKFLWSQCDWAVDYNRGIGSWGQVNVHEDVVVYLSQVKAKSGLG